MVRIAGGLSHAEFDAKPRMYTNINSVSPLKHDFPMLDGAMRLARRGQPVVITPFTLAGAMAPVTMSGAVALSMAEGLAAAALVCRRGRTRRVALKLRARSTPASATTLEGRPSGPACIAGGRAARFHR